MAAERYMVTKQHRHFTEFADTVRRDRCIGLCYGPAGVGKTLSARRHAHWDDLEPQLTLPVSEVPFGIAETDWRTIVFTPSLTSGPALIDRVLITLSRRLADLHAEGPYDPKEHAPPHASSAYTELLIVDEADRLKMAGLEQVRDHYDRSQLGLILIGMPGIEQRLARYPHLYSRIGFVHEYRPLSADELAHVLTRQYPEFRLDTEDDFFTVAEAIAAIAQITGGNLRLAHRLVTQVQRLLQINELRTVTKDVVEAARESLVLSAR